MHTDERSDSAYVDAGIPRLSIARALPPSPLPHSPREDSLEWSELYRMIRVDNANSVSESFSSCKQLENFPLDYVTFKLETGHS